MSLTEQLPIPFPGLTLDPSPAMAAGTQVAHQCAWCGTVVICPTSQDGTRYSPSGQPCPACRSTAGWWRQELHHDAEGLAGFRWVAP